MNVQNTVTTVKAMKPIKANVRYSSMVSEKLLIQCFCGAFDKFYYFGKIIGEIIMTYRVEQFVAKIKSPVVAVIEDRQIEYADGKVLSETSFSKLFRIESLTAKGDRIIIKLVENDRLNDTNWTGEEQAGFFDG